MYEEITSGTQKPDIIKQNCRGVYSKYDSENIQTSLSAKGKQKHK